LLVWFTSLDRSLHDLGSILFQLEAWWTSMDRSHYIHGSIHSALDNALITS
jgi:hypothetical protein